MVNSYEEKILKFDVRDGYNDLMCIFDEDEIEEMRKGLENEYGYDYSYLTMEVAKEEIIIDFVREWLVDNVRVMSLYECQQLLDILYMD